MGTLKIVQFGHPVLREKSKKVTTVGAREQSLIAHMIDTMYHARGIGLAANQVGVPLRIFVADADQERTEDGSEEETRNPIVFINPEIIWESEEDDKYDEGCLSIPGINGDVYRPVAIRIAAHDENFEPFELELDDLWARVFQHELDHLDGVLFVDKFPLLKRGTVAAKLHALKADTLENLPPDGTEYPILEKP